MHSWDFMLASRYAQLRDDSTRCTRVMTDSLDLKVWLSYLSHTEAPHPNGQMQPRVAGSRTQHENVRVRTHFAQCLQARGASISLPRLLLLMDSAHCRLGWRCTQDQPMQDLTVDLA